ncbi:MAG: hypothetical protein ACLP05_09970 [Candidatus Kryptoniota bacterium]
MARTPLSAYRELQKNFIADVKSENNGTLITAIARDSVSFLKKQGHVNLRSLVPNKSYFAFSKGKKISRAVNRDLFIDDIDAWQRFLDSINDKAIAKIEPLLANKLIYTVAISFCCFIDLTKEGDQKTPGTFFEYLIGHLFAKRLAVNPTKELEVLNLDMKTTLPTDFIFNLGPEKPKFHLPVKTSSRERVIQVWAHQRVLDGVYGTGRFLGTPVILAETKSDKRKREVIEICLPDQWRIYQMHIAQLKRIYYLDVPTAYRKLNEVFPRIAVKSFGDFFREVDVLTQ